MSTELNRGFSQPRSEKETDGSSTPYTKIYGNFLVEPVHRILETSHPCASNNQLIHRNKFLNHPQRSILKAL
jgi:hypothetical protein